MISMVYRVCSNLFLFGYAKFVGIFPVPQDPTKGSQRRKPKVYTVAGITLYSRLPRPENLATQK